MRLWECLNFEILILIHVFRGRTTREYLKNKKVVTGASEEKNDFFGITPCFVDYRRIVTEEELAMLQKYEKRMNAV